MKILSKIRLEAAEVSLVKLFNDALSRFTNGNYMHKQVKATSAGGILVDVAYGCENTRFTADGYIEDIVLDSIKASADRFNIDPDNVAISQIAVSSPKTFETPAYSQIAGMLYTVQVAKTELQLDSMLYDLVLRYEDFGPAGRIRLVISSK